MILNLVGPRGSRWIIVGLMSVASLAFFPARSFAATPEQVDQAIAKGKAALWKEAKANGGIWDKRTAPASAQAGLESQWGGTTALITYALLASGESRDDPRFKAPIDFLINSKNMTGIYAIGMRANVWPFLNTRAPEIREAVARDYKLLHSSAHAAEPRGPKAFYRYTVASGDYDHSASQYGVLGMWAIDAVGGEIPDAYWQAVEAGWRNHQNKDGGWGYVANGKGSESYGTMTAAGVASLFITQDFLHSLDGVQCPGNVVDKHLEGGLGWIAKNFSEYVNGTHPVYYGWYGIERVGVASGYKYFGTTDWYREGADFLLKKQLANGLWGNEIELSDTAFALLFLSRGRAPVALNKLQYVIDPHGDKPQTANWNQRPRDAAHLARWTGKQIERDLNWQIVNLDAPVEDMHDAPILYIAGNQNFALRDKDYDKLRQYVQEGGLIVGNADCNNADFVVFFTRLGKTLFPGYVWQELPNDHVMFSEQFTPDKWTNKSIKALTNGSRVLMLLLPSDGVAGDFARYWQTATYGGHEEAFQFMDDLFLYAVDRGDKGGLQNKGETYVVRKKDKTPATQSVKVARIKYDGNWDPEPAGWERLGAILHNDKKTAFDLDVQPVQLGEGTLTKGGFKFAHLTGTAAIKLSAEGTAELNKFLMAGGTLLVDACGGNGEFAGSMEQLLPTLLPGGALDPVPPGDRIFGKPYPVKDVEYRRYSRRTLGNLHSPRIKGIPVTGRTAIYYSAEDISTALVGEPVDGIIGYVPQVATDMVANLAASYVKLPATTRATTKMATKPSTKPATPAKK